MSRNIFTHESEACELQNKTHYISKTPEPIPSRSWGKATSSAPNKHFTHDTLLETERIMAKAGPCDHASIIVEDLNSAIPKNDLEQGLHGLFSVFGNVSSVVTVSEG